MAARRNIMKRGSFDSYILKTDPKKLDSKFGVFIRQLMKKRQKDPSFKLPIIPGHANLPRTRKTQHWEYNHIPAIYLPASANLHEDMSQYYLKTPQEMSRYEIAELEEDLRRVMEGAG